VIGVLGGTFDPVHHGHLRFAVEAVESLRLRVLKLVPASAPPHRRTPAAPAADRLAMLRTAVAGTATLEVDGRELDRAGPSYTFDTLASLRQDHPDEPLCLCLGADAFRAFDTWHRWREIPGLAHLAVARRPGGRLPARGPVAALLTAARVETPEALRERRAGGIAVMDLPGLQVSATRIRALLAARRDPRWLLPDPVLAYILERGLYLARS
jgi:nicotinate-nucleotide adenylyltransferase